MNAKKTFNVLIERNVPATMRDGTILYTDVWRPDADGTFPTLLTRTPYDKSQPRNASIAGVDPVRTVGEGYVVIYQDVRGRFTSQGDWSFEQESSDGYDSVEWAAQLPYSDGNIGMFGLSYLGFTQWMAAVAQPPHLKAIFPMQMGAGIRDFLFPGNAFAVGSAIFWGAGQTGNSLMRRAASGEDVMSSVIGLLDVLDHIPDAFDRLPLLGGNPSVSGNLPAYREWLLHAEDTAYWKRMSYADRLGRVDVPVFHLGSWHDAYAGSAPSLFAGMRARGGSEVTRQSQKLLMGPWTHGQMDSDVIGELYMGLSATSALIDLAGLHLKWFDHWLKGSNTGVLDEPPVRIFVMGENKWRSEHEWPLARTAWTNFYLHSGGRANTRDGDGGLDTTAPVAAEPHDVYVYDPRNPVPTVGGPTVLPGTGIGANSGPREQARVESRADVLIYTSPPLEKDLEVTGPLTATIFAASSVLDTDWTVKLVDVHPDGRSYGLADGICRARYRNGGEHADLLEPGQICEYKIDLQATSNVFKAGHRIRLQVSSSNFPRFSRNQNTGASIPLDTELKSALQTILHDHGHPSHIRLPVIPR
jgi:putative CocE/NonD family hydrolase